MRRTALVRPKDEMPPDDSARECAVCMEDCTEIYALTCGRCFCTSAKMGAQTTEANTHTAVAAAQFIALVWKPSRKPETIATAVHASSFADICGESSQ